MLTKVMSHMYFIIEMLCVKRSTTHYISICAWYLCTTPAFVLSPKYLVEMYGKPNTKQIIPNTPV